MKKGAQLVIVRKKHIFACINSLLTTIVVGAKQRLVGFRFMHKNLKLLGGRGRECTGENSPDLNDLLQNLCSF